MKCKAARAWALGPGAIKGRGGAARDGPAGAGEPGLARRGVQHARGAPAATMYVGYVLDKDSPGYPGPARPAGLGLSPQAYSPAPPAPPQYPDFTGYSHVEPLPAPSAAWSAPFPAPKDDWAPAYGPGPPAPAGSPAPLAFGPPPDLSAGPAPPGPGPGLLLQPLGGPAAPSSPGAPRRTPYEWMRRTVAAGGAGGGGGKDPFLAPVSFLRDAQGPRCRCQGERPRVPPL